MLMHSESLLISSTTSIRSSSLAVCLHLTFTPLARCWRQVQTALVTTYARYPPQQSGYPAASSAQKVACATLVPNAEACTFASPAARCQVCFGTAFHMRHTAYCTPHHHTITSQCHLASQGVKPYFSLTGSFQALPSAISDVCGPPKRTAQQRQTALRHMDFLLRKQLLQVSSCYI